MRTTHAHCCAALLAIAGFGFATSALAQDKTAKIGVLNDMSSLYADIGGPNSVAAVDRSTPIPDRTVLHGSMPTRSPGLRAGTPLGLAPTIVTGI